MKVLGPYSLGSNKSGFCNEAPPMPKDWKKGFGDELKEGEVPFIRLGQWFLHCKDEMVYSFHDDVFYTLRDYNHFFG